MVVYDQFSFRCWYNCEVSSMNFLQTVDLKEAPLSSDPLSIKALPNIVMVIRFLSFELHCQSIVKKHQRLL